MLQGSSAPACQSSGCSPTLFYCSCRDQAIHCYVYLFLPVFIIFLLILWTNRSFQRVWRRPCLLPCFSFFRHIFEAFLVGLLWIAFVFIDGDWYLCCLNDHSEQQAPLACKSAGKITEKEQAIIADLKNTSRVSFYYCRVTVLRKCQEHCNIII